jgi:hypothetical protein
MNQAFDYNGVVVSKSKPVSQLKTVKKTLIVDSADRDTLKYHTNGDFVVFLPRVYENVVSLRLMAAEFPLLVKPSSGSTVGAITHVYSDSINYSTTYINTNDKVVAVADNIYYFMLDIEGLNKSDETAVSANRSTFPDGTFAKIPVAYSNSSTFIEYNDHSGQDNIAKYTPPIGKLDRLHIRTRLHNQQGNLGFIYWTTDGAKATATSVSTNQKGGEFSLSFEIEMIDNVFDDYSGFESRLGNRS